MKARSAKNTNNRHLHRVAALVVLGAATIAATAPRSCVDERRLDRIAVPFGQQLRSSEVPWETFGLAVARHPGPPAPGGPSSTWSTRPVVATAAGYA